MEHSTAGETQTWGVTRLVVCLVSYLFLHHFRVHVRDKADGEFSNDFPGDDRLGPSIGERPLDAVERERWIPPAVHEDLLLHEIIRKQLY